MAIKPSNLFTPAQLVAYLPQTNSKRDLAYFTNLLAMANSGGLVANMPTSLTIQDWQTLVTLFDPLQSRSPLSS